LVRDSESNRDDQLLTLMRLLDLSYHLVRSRGSVRSEQDKCLTPFDGLINLEQVRDSADAVLLEGPRREAQLSQRQSDARGDWAILFGVADENIVMSRHFASTSSPDRKAG